MTPPLMEGMELEGRKGQTRTARARAYLFRHHHAMQDRGLNRQFTFNGQYRSTIIQCLILYVEDGFRNKFQSTLFPVFRLTRVKEHEEFHQSLHMLKYIHVPLHGDF